MSTIRMCDETWLRNTKALHLFTVIPVIQVPIHILHELVVGGDIRNLIEREEAKAIISQFEDGYPPENMMVNPWKKLIKVCNYR